MIQFSSCGLLIAAVAVFGCEQRKPVDMARPGTAIVASSLPDPRDVSANVDFQVEDVVRGERIDPFANSEAKAVVLIFVSTDCPIANQYAPELNRLSKLYQRKDVSFWLVFADPDEMSEKIRRHLEDYHYQIPALRDPDHQLVKLCGVVRTPEAAVFAPERDRRYRGRIDNRFTDFGKSRTVASQHNLQEAIESVLAGRSVATPVTEAIGCYIPGVIQ